MHFDTFLVCVCDCYPRDSVSELTTVSVPLNSFAAFEPTMLRMEYRKLEESILFLDLWLIVGCACGSSLQFDPAPRRGDPHVTRRTPDYFL